MGIVLICPAFVSQTSSEPQWLAPFPGIQRPQTVPYRAGTDVPPPKLIHRVEPPRSALPHGSGTVWLQLVINEKGQVWQARVLDMPNLKTDEVMAAVRQWRYEPTIVAGLPVPVVTVATIEYHLAGRLEGVVGGNDRKCGAIPPHSIPVRTGRNAQASKLLHKVEPKLPPGTTGAGHVVLQITLNEQGDVYEVRPVSGPADLARAAAAAVCQWKYSPTYLNGKPVAVISTVDFQITSIRRR